MSKKNLLFGITSLVVLFVTFGRGIPAHAATLSFSAPATVSVGEVFPLDVLVDSGDRGFNAAEASVLFSNNVLEVVSVDTAPASTIFNFWLSPPSFLNDKGVVSFSGGTTHGVVGRAIQILSIRMRARGSGESLITASGASINASDGSGTNILDSVKALRITVMQAPVIIPAKSAPAPQATSSPTSGAKDDCAAFFSVCDPHFPTIDTVTVTPNKEFGSNIFVAGTAVDGTTVRLRLYRSGVLYKEIDAIVTAQKKWEGVLSDIPAYGVYSVDAIAENDNGRASQPFTWAGITILPPYTFSFFGHFIRWYMVLEGLLLALLIGCAALFAYRSFLARERMRPARGMIVALSALCVACIGMSITTYFLWDAEYNPPTVYWKNTDIPCIHRVHSLSDVYSSAKLEVYVDGTLQAIPTEIGIAPGCVAQIHSHDNLGDLHFETLPTRPATLADFFTVAGEPLNREGYTLSATVNGKEYAGNMGGYALQNGDALVITYTSISSKKGK